MIITLNYTCDDGSPGWAAVESDRIVTMYRKTYKDGSGSVVVVCNNDWNVEMRCTAEQADAFLALWKDAK